MRARVQILSLILMTVPLLIGCEKSPQERLQGRWLGDSIENVPASQLTKATGWVKGTALEFQGNKVTVTIPAETPRTGSFKVAKAEGNTLTVSFLREEGGHDEADFELVNEQRMHWKIGAGQEIVLSKVKR